MDKVAGPNVDITLDIEGHFLSANDRYDVVKITDVLHLVRDPALGLCNVGKNVRAGGRLIYTRTHLRPGYEDADRGPRPTVEHGTVTPLGDLTTLFAQLVYERWAWSRPVLSRFMRYYRPRPINPNFPPWALAFGIVETR